MIEFSYLIKHVASPPPTDGAKQLTFYREGGLFLMALLNDYYLIVMEKIPHLLCSVVVPAMKRGIFDNGNDEK